MNTKWRPVIGLAAAAAVVALGVTGVAAHNLSGHGVGLLTLTTEESPSPSAAPSPVSPSPASQTFQLIGGMVTLTCTGGAISIDEATPNTGFTVEQKVEDGQAEVRFESATHESRLEATCAGDQVQVEELREEAVEAEAPETPAPPAPAPAPPQSSTRTFSLVGGTVTVTCTGNTLTVDSATPNAGFSMEQELKDDDNAVEFRFESSSHESRLEVSCANGQVQVQELREENS
jgi:hypothetical protein